MEREARAFGEATALPSGVPSWEEIQCIYVPETCGRQPEELPAAWAPGNDDFRGAGVEYRPCTSAIDLDGPPAASCESIPSTLPDGEWVTLPLDTASYNRSLSETPGDAGSPLSQVDLRRGIPLRGAAARVQTRGGKAQLLAASLPSFDMVRPARNRLYGGNPREKIPHAGFAAFSLGDVFRRLAGARRCRAEDVGGPGPVRRRLGCDGFTLTELTPGLESTREYELTLGAGWRLDLSMEFHIIGGLRRPSGRGVELSEEVEQVLRRRGDLRPAVPLDGVFVGLGNVHDDPLHFAAASPWRGNPWFASLFGVGAGDGRSYAAKGARRLLGDGGAPGFVFKGELTSAQSTRAVQGDPRNAHWVYEPEVERTPYFVALTHPGAGLEGRVSRALDFDPAFFEPELLFNEAISRFATGACRTVRFDITLFSPDEAWDVVEAIRDGDNEVFDDCTRGDGLVIPYRVSATIGWQTRRGFDMRTHMYSRDILSQKLSVSAPIGDVSGVLCVSAQRAAGVGVFFGAMMQDAPPGQSVGVEIECVSARWSRR